MGIQNEELEKINKEKFLLIDEIDRLNKLLKKSKYINNTDKNTLNNISDEEIDNKNDEIKKLNGIIKKLRNDANKKDGFISNNLNINKNLKDQYQHSIEKYKK